MELFWSLSSPLSSSSSISQLLSNLLVCMVFYRNPSLRYSHQHLYLSLPLTAVVVMAAYTVLSLLDRWIAGEVFSQIIYCLQLHVAFGQRERTWATYKASHVSRIGGLIIINYQNSKSKVRPFRSSKKNNWRPKLSERSPIWRLSPLSLDFFSSYPDLIKTYDHKIVQCLVRSFQPFKDFKLINFPQAIHSRNGHFDTKTDG